MGWGRMATHARRRVVQLGAGLCPFHSHYLMGGQVLVEPDIGTRATQGIATAESGVALILGESALNAEKDALKGMPETQKMCWGSKRLQ